MKNITPSIATYSGKNINLDNLTTECIDLVDIAKGLSNVCRFGGQCEEFYSVAQHSILVSLLVPLPYALEGLLHDAAEAFIGDMPSPFKKNLTDYMEMENKIESVIKRFFSLPPIKSPEVKSADLIALATECRDLNFPRALSYPPLRGIAPSDKHLVTPWPPKRAFQEFIARYDSITQSSV
ncbi:HD family hydrolase [Serratia liquefaciens]|uniref:HD family hydrolase n=1 Tax=Serratia liquefaciens TaxID=614 RepID=UPI00217B048B|nr:HD family hydrolase [Serratia liquefaciens]CAI1149395.1 Uncharacterised protein [Serratia liquefaciens]